MLCMVLTAIALSALVIGSGCGGSTKPPAQAAGSNSANTTTQTKKLTDAELIAATDSACRRIHAKLASYHISTIAQLGSVARELSDYESQVVADLDKLTPSTSLASDWKQIVADLHILASNTARVGDLTRKQEFNQSTGLIREVNDARQRVLAIAMRDGFRGCTQIVR